MNFKLFGKSAPGGKTTETPQRTILTYSLSDKGGKQINDDTAAIFRNGGNVRVFVGDGLGGYAGGKQASEAAAKALKAACRGNMHTDAQLIQAAADANRAVFDLQKRTGGKMKTTMVFLSLEKDTARWMHVGDTRLYIFKDGVRVFQTADHSVSYMAVLMGEITMDQIRFHEDRNRVLRALGGENAKPELSAPRTLEDGEYTFLMCTDGFWEYVKEDEMERTLAESKTPEEWILAMEKILLTRVTTDNDNYTAAAVFCR